MLSNLKTITQHKFLSAILRSTQIQPQNFITREIQTQTQTQIHTFTSTSPYHFNNPHNTNIKSIITLQPIQTQIRISVSTIPSQNKLLELSYQLKLELTIKKKKKRAESDSYSTRRGISMKLARLSRLQRLGETSIFFFLRLLGERSVDVSGQRRGPSSWRAPLLILFPAHLCCHRSPQIYLLGIRILLVFYQEASR